jgi:hypothetical protein
MTRNDLLAIPLATLALVAAFGAARPVQAQDTKPKYPNMAPMSQYLIADRDAEIALARTGAPASISGDAEVMVLGPKDYEVAAQGKNGFVCVVERAWGSNFGDAEFWNPKIRSPICFNAQAAQSAMALYLNRTKMVLSGKSQAEMLAAISSGLDKQELPTPLPGAMCYMLSKQGYLNDLGGHWHPHVMFFRPSAEAAAWGANLPGSPIFASDDAADRLAVLMVPVTTWSDGTPDSAGH